MKSRDPAVIAQQTCALHHNKADALIEIFHDLQHELGFVPDAVLPVIANAINRSRAEVYGVLTFYHDFRREPAGRTVVKVCRAEACQAMGSDSLCRHAERRLGVPVGETDAAGNVTLEAVYCLGNCALSPAMLVNGTPHGRVTTKRFDEILAAIRLEAAE
jgi:formate dehydrogenase subunit gamma